MLQPTSVQLQSGERRRGSWTLAALKSTDVVSRRNDEDKKRDSASRNRTTSCRPRLSGNGIMNRGLGGPPIPGYAPVGMTNNYWTGSNPATIQSYSQTNGVSSLGAVSPSLQTAGRTGWPNSHCSLMGSSMYDVAGCQFLPRPLLLAGDR